MSWLKTAMYCEKCHKPQPSDANGNCVACGYPGDVEGKGEVTPHPAPFEQTKKSDDKEVPYGQGLRDERGTQVKDAMLAAKEAYDRLSEMEHGTSQGHEPDPKTLHGIQTALQDALETVQEILGRTEN